ncbi:MAG: glycosyltransferase family 4 protein [Nitrospirae bacterium]|nr:glycosyltransferase family 4 protein [Nitrospirota bacterium]
MKILHLIYDHMSNPWVGGGGAVRVYELYRRLSEKGHEITIISGMYPGSSAYKEGGIEYKFLGTDRNYILSTFSYAFHAGRFLKRHGDEFDIVVEDFAPWNPVFSRFLTKKPVILHVNHKEGWGIFKRWWFLGLPFFLIEAFYPRLFSRITALSEGTKKKLGLSHTVVFPAGINSNLLMSELSEEGDYILYIGRLHIKNKGLDSLFDAMKGVDTLLFVVGRGRDEQRLKELAQRLKLKNVVFRGFLSEEEKIDVLRAAKVFVLPSRFEGWGIVVLEAAACGRPVIVSDIPELSFAIQGGFGISFKTGSSKDLAQKINLLLKDDVLRHRMADKARPYAKDYTWDNISKGYERFLMDVAGL